MISVDTFLTELYVMADDFCKTLPPLPVPPGTRRVNRESGSGHDRGPGLMTR